MRILLLIGMWIKTIFWYIPHRKIEYLWFKYIRRVDFNPLITRMLSVYNKYGYPVDNWNNLMNEFPDMIWIEDGLYKLYDSISDYRVVLKNAGDCIPHYEQLWVLENNKVIKKKICDISVGDLVLSYNFQEFKLEYMQVKRKINSGQKKIKRLYYKNNSYSDFSEDHRIFSRKSRNNHKYKEISVKDFDKDFVKSKSNSSNYKKTVPVIKELPYVIKDDKMLTDEICYLYGYFLAEGWVDKKTKYKRVFIAGHDISENILPIIEKLNIPFSIRYRKKDNLPIIELLKKSWIKDLFLKSLNNSFSMNIPDIFLNLPKSKLQNILDGYALGDGYHRKNKDELTYTTSCDNLKDFIVEISYKLGNPVSPYFQKNHMGVGKKPIWRIIDNSNSRFKKDHGYKQLSEVKISKIEDIEEYVDMFDIEVDKNHNFIMVSSGTIVHNCDDFTTVALEYFGKSFFHGGLYRTEGYTLLLSKNMLNGHSIAIFRSTSDNSMFVVSNREMKYFRNECEFYKWFKKYFFDPYWEVTLDVDLSLKNVDRYVIPDSSLNIDC